MKYKDLSVIETDWITEKLNRIKELNEANFGKYEMCLIILQDLKLKLKPLEPLIIQTITDSGREMHDKSIIHNWKGVYQKLDIDKWKNFKEEYLNKEIDL